jgi:hypothetical protein
MSDWVVHKTFTPIRTVGGLTGKFKRIAAIYKQFGEAWQGLDFSDRALLDMFHNEAYGVSLDERRNGYYVGKQFAGVTIDMWKEDIARGYLGRAELYADPRLPHWWLDRVLKD